MEVVINQKVDTEKEFGPEMQCITSQVISEESTIIGYRQIGSGPGMIIMHGGFLDGYHYLRLAETMASSFIVFMPDRRGRGLSGPYGKGYRVETEIEDLKALLQKTVASAVFAHIAGGFFALEAALRLPIQKLALYEPAISIEGSLPVDWLAKFEKALSKDDSAAAFVRLLKGLQLNWMSKLPDWTLIPLARLMLKGDDGMEMAALLKSGAREAKEIYRCQQLGSTYKRYRAINADTLLMAGTSSPDYLRLAVRELSRTIPRARHVELARLDHNAPDQNTPEQVASELKKFFIDKEN